MRVLAVSGSPRQGGNSDTAARAILGTLGADPDTSFVRIADHGIKPCIGCWSCRTGDACSITGDDFDVLIQRITEAELVFFCEPVYWHAPPGIVKNARIDPSGSRSRNPICSRGRSLLWRRSPRGAGGNSTTGSPRRGFAILEAKSSARSPSGRRIAGISRETRPNSARYEY